MAISGHQRPSEAIRGRRTDEVRMDLAEQSRLGGEVFATHGQVRVHAALGRARRVHAPAYALPLDCLDVTEAT